MTPEIGMGATEVMYSDRVAYTIIDVHKNKDGKVTAIKIQEDNAIRTDNNGQSDVQSYRYEPNPKGEIKTATLRKTGYFRLKGPKGSIIRIGVRDAYYDYGF